MRFDLFAKLTTSDAQELLQQFLEDGVMNVDIVRAHAEAADVRCDYSIESLNSFLQWAFAELKIVPREADLNVSEWIRSTEEYRKGLYDFDNRSKNLICHAAYYLGECFVRNFPQLSWATGNRESADGYVNAEANMPIVKGFRHKIELAPLLVLENLFRRVIENPERTNDVRKMVETWKGYI